MKVIPHGQKHTCNPKRSVVHCSRTIISHSRHKNRSSFLSSLAMKLRAKQRQQRFALLTLRRIDNEKFNGECVSASEWPTTRQGLSDSLVCRKYDDIALAIYNICMYVQRDPPVTFNASILICRTLRRE